MYELLELESFLSEKRKSARKFYKLNISVSNTLFWNTCTIEVFLDPYTDYSFKKLFGPDSSKGLLIDFLNAVLKPDKLIVEIVYLNNEQLGITEYDRRSVF